MLSTDDGFGIPPAPTSDLIPPPLGSSPSGPRGWTALAWILIGLVVVTRVWVLPMLAGDASGTDTSMERIMARLQGRYLVGAGQFFNGERLFAEAESMNVGSVGQRQRFVVIAGELAGPRIARKQLDSLNELIAAESSGGGSFELTPEQAAVQEVLDTIYPPLDDEAASDPTTEPGDGDGDDEAEAAPVRVPPSVLSDDQRATLLEGLDWFGQLALAPPGAGEDATREPLIASARTAFLTIILGLGGAGLLGIAGFIGLAVLVVMAFIGAVPRRLLPSNTPHGIYAETFAVWMIVFFGGQFLAGEISSFAPATQLVPVVVMFFVSLIALAWPRLRGLSWERIRDDVGLTLPPPPWREPLLGLACYAMGLTILAIGITLTLGLMLVDAAFAGEVPALEPVTGPAHPVILSLAAGDPWTIVQVLVLGAVAAPIIEETMFRGVLYRHLRDASDRLGFVMSVVFGTVLNSFVFAIIHPQGWIAIPALMSLAVAFTLAREWRGSVIPSMVMHGVSNALVLSLLVVLVAE